MHAAYPEPVGTYPQLSLGHMVLRDCPESDRAQINVYSNRD